MLLTFIFFQIKLFHPFSLLFLKKNDLKNIKVIHPNIKLPFIRSELINYPKKEFGIINEKKNLKSKKNA